MRILVSGFEPFGGDPLNPTSRLVEALPSLAPKAGGEVRGIVLPVTFKEAFERLSAEIRAWDPDVVLSLGLAAGRSDSIELERIAINCLDANIPDNSGVQPRDLPIEPDGEAGLFSTLPLRSMLEALSAAKVPAKISNSAGTYVCNFLMYRTLEMNLRTRRRCGFVHVPYLPEQVEKKPGVPSMNWEKMSQALSIMVTTLAGGGSVRGSSK